MKAIRSEVQRKEYLKLLESLMITVRMINYEAKKIAVQISKFEEKKYPIQKVSKKKIKNFKMKFTKL